MRKRSWSAAASAFAVLMLVCLSQANGAAILSDDFNPTTSEPNPAWRFYDPYDTSGANDPGESILTFNGVNVLIGIPAGQSHDLWSDSYNKAPRLLQSADNTDFDIQVKFESNVSKQYQLQGIVVQQTNDNFIRFDIVHDGNSPRVFSAYLNGAAFTVFKSEAISGTPAYVRVTRTGNQWTYRYSSDGATWIEAVTFNQPITVAEVGFFGGTHTPSPAFMASVDYFMNLASPIADTDVSVPQSPQIEVWYGDTINAGLPGNAQQWVNILGNVSSPTSIASLTYSLNGAAEQALSIGPETADALHTKGRLVGIGDFNIELNRAGLAIGTNLVSIKAVDSEGLLTTKTVSVQYSAGSTWPLPFTADWSSLTDINEVGSVAQVVDGLWSLAPEGIRAVQTGYDRVIAIGDMTWQTDYEVVVPIKINSSFSGIGFAVGWQGHEGIQSPKIEWPLQCLAWLRGGSGGTSLDIVSYGGLTSWENVWATKPVAVAVNGTYNLKARSESLGGGVSRFYVKFWAQGSYEPANWDVAADVPTRAGSVLLLAYEADVTFGNVAITPLSSPLPPSITTQPQSQAVTAGQTASFSISAIGSGTLNYQWRRNGTDIPGATGASYTTHITILTDNGAVYTCFVSNEFGSILSNPAALTVTPISPPSINTQPVNQVVTSGQPATFTIAATGSGIVVYQWKRNGVDISGANSSSYVIPATILADGGSVFTCVVGNSGGSVVSNPATLTVTVAPSSLLLNQGFESGTSPWAFYSDGSGAFNNNASGYESPHAGHVILTSQGSNIQLNQAGITLEANSQYRLTFKAYSNTGHDMEVSLTKDISPYTYYGLNYYPFDLATTWATYSVQFTTTGFTGTVSDARFWFWFAWEGRAGDQYFVDDVVLEKIASPTITGQPANQSVVTGQSATFTIVASGSEPLAYQWKRDGTDIPGATGASFTIPAVVIFDNNASFTCTVGNSLGSVASNAAILAVTAGAPPAITAQPASETVMEGESATFNVDATGAEPLAYQWRRNGFDIPGAAGVSYTVPATALSDNGEVFSCRISNVAGSVVSNGAILTVTPIPTPVISTQPTGRSVTAGETTTFSVVATGIGTLTYQWKRNGTNIPGATGASYTTAATVLSDNGAVFSCVVGNSGGSVTSDPAVLTVVPGIPVLLSDDFNSATTEPNPSWRFYDPYNTTASSDPGESAFSLNGTNALIAIPAGLTHNLFAAPENKAPRILQAVPDEDFGVEVKFESAPSSQYQMQGIVIQQTNDIFLRFEVYHDGTAPHLLAAYINGAAFTVHGDMQLPNVPPCLRVIRSGDQWTFRYSGDGATWTDGFIFSQSMTVTEAGFYAATHTPNPDFLCSVDYFMNLALPVLDLDSQSQLLRSDDFNPATTEQNPTWRFYDPYDTTASDDTGQSTLSFNGSDALINIPAGLSHLLWTGSENKAPRLLQPVPDADFGVEVKFESQLSSGYQLQGIIVQQTNDIFLRLETYYDGTAPHLYAAYVNGADTQAYADITLGSMPQYLRVIRLGSQWAFRYSSDRTAWSDGAVFTQTMAVTEVGFYGGNYTPNPAFLARADYFMNLAAPVVDIDEPVQLLPPVITAHPMNQSVMEGQSAAFAVTAAGSGPLSYQWKRNGMNIPGATSSSHTIATAGISDNNAAFTCTVSNSVDSVTSNPAILTVTPIPPPVIIAQPISQNVTAGETATFTISGAGTAPLSYQWRKNGINIAGATGSSYTTPTTTVADSGSVFSCALSNPGGSTASSPAMLTVTTPSISLISNPGFESGLSPWTFFSNGSATFNNDAPGDGSAHAGHVTITAGGSNVQLYQPGVVLENGAQYRLSFRAYSNTGHDVQISLKKHTAPYTNYAFDYFEFDLTNTWAAYSVQFTASGFTGTVNDGRFWFWLAWSSSAGDQYFFDDVMLEKLSSPSISGQPSSQTVIAGQTATFTALASGTGQMSYQWKRNDVAIQGAASPVYTTPATALSDNGSQFTCTVSNNAGSVTSNVAILTVNPGTPPSITAQPSNQSVAAGQTATFSVVAAGSAPLAYQWQLNGTNVQGATNASYTTPATTLSDSGVVFTCVVGNGTASVISNPAVLIVVPAALTILSDDFNPATTEPNPSWRFYDPYDTTSSNDPGQSTLSFNGANALIAIPAGLTHNLFANPENKAPRLLQAAPNTNFGVEVKFESTPSAMYQMQGIVVQQSDSTFLRFEIYHDGAVPHLFAVYINGATYTIFGDMQLAAVPHYLRVIRSGNQWTLRYSGDGSIWMDGAVFIQNMTVTEIGLYAATHTPNPAYIAGVDYFMNLASPIVDVDSAIQLPLSDDFNPATTELNPTWRFYDPYDTTAADDPGQSAVAFNGTNTLIIIPADLPHNLWTGSDNKAPRLLQPAYDTDFGVEVKFESALSSQYQMQGIIVQQTNDIFLRLEIYYDTAGLHLFAAYVNGADSEVYADTPIPGSAQCLRVIRLGNQWIFRYSADGATWVDGIAFNRIMAVSEVGFYGGNYTPNPAFMVSADYFINIAAPVVDIDLPSQMIPPSIATGPASQTVAEGQTATFTIVAAGSTPLAYQWQLDGTDISGATGASYTTPATNPSYNNASFTCKVSNSLGSVTSVPAVLTVVPSSPTLLSDDFDPTTTEMNPAWRFYDPYDTTSAVDPGQSSLSFDGAHALISIPAGLSHDLWVNNMRTPRVLQTIDNNDFGIEVKFTSQVSLQYQFQGIVVQQTDNSLLRFDVVHDGISPRIFAAYIDNSNPLVYKDLRVSTAPLYLRAIRSGSQWTFRYSYDGVAWTDAVMFNKDLTVSEVGFFGGNHTPSPAFVSSADYFMNLAAPF